MDVVYRSKEKVPTAESALLPRVVDVRIFVIAVLSLSFFFFHATSAFAACTQRQVCVGPASECIPRIVTECDNSDGSSTRTETQPITGRSTTVTTATDGTQTTSSENQNNTNPVASFFQNLGLAAILTPVVVISFVILAFASFLLYLSGILFNWSLGYLVYNFGTFFGNSSGLLLAWGILRDFGNIVLLFGFVYMGIQTILNIGHFNVGKTLSRLVIFAVLLNFSLFIAEGIIDVTNALATTIYKQTSDRCDTVDFDCLSNNGLASEILDRASLASALTSGQTLQGVGSSQGTLNQETGSQGGFGGFIGGVVNYFTNPIGETLKYLGLALMVSTAAIVLIAGALLLISRAIHLTFLMVISPIGFAGMAVPWLEKMAGDWWNTLIKQAMFAPVFLLLLFVALKILEGLTGLTNSAGVDLAQAISTADGINTGPILFFALVIGFLIGALLTAKNFGIYAADTITKSALGMIKGVGSFPFTPYRDMAGAGAKNLGKRYNVLAANTAKFADRVTPGLLKPIVKATGAAIDSSIYGGLKGAQNIKVGGKSYADRQKEIEEREKSSTDALRRDTLKKDLGAAIGKARTGDKEDLDKMVNTTANVSDLIEHKAFKGESDSDLSAMVDPEVMGSARLKQVLDHKDVSEEVKNKIRELRFNRPGSNIRADITTGGAALKKWSADDIAISGALSDPTTRAEFARKASNDLFDGATKNSSVGQRVAQDLKSLRNGTGTGARFSAAHARNTLQNSVKSKEDRAKLPSATLTTRHVMDELRPADFGQIAKTNALDDADRPVMANYIRSVRAMPPTDPRKQALDDWYNNQRPDIKQEFDDYFR